MEQQDKRVIRVQTGEAVVGNTEGRPFVKTLEAVAVMKNEGSSDIKSRWAAFESMGRSLVDKITSKKVAWGGDYKVDVFGDRDMKGTGDEMGNPHIRIQACNDGALVYETQGMMDVDDVDGAKELSNTVRGDLGLLTENPVKFTEVMQVNIDGRMASMEQWREWAKETAPKWVNMFINNQKEMTRELFVKRFKVPAVMYTMIAPLIDLEMQILKKIKIEPAVNKHINTARFFVMERDLQTEERLCDVAACKNEDEFNKVCEPVMKWLNVATEAKNNGLIPDTPKPDKFDARSHEDIKRYFGNWLPEQMGIYLARMHKKEYFAGYPHMQNWSMAASLYDLSSCFVRKDGLTAEKRELEQITDVAGTVAALVETVRPTDESYLKTEFPELAKETSAALIKSYFHESGLEVSEKNLYRLFRKISAQRPYLNQNDGRRDMSKRLMTREEFNEWIAKPMGIDFSKGVLSEYGIIDYVGDAFDKLFRKDH